MVEIRLGVKPLLGLGEEERPAKRAADSSLAKMARPRRRKGAPREIELKGLPYLSFPPSPPAWDLRRAKEGGFHEACGDPRKRAVFEAYSKNQYNKVVGLISTVSIDERTGEIGHTFLKAYRKLVQRWRKKDRLAVALKWSAEMVENLPHLVNDTDRRRHNKLVAKLDATGRKHAFSKVDVPKSNKGKGPRFSVSEASGWQIVEEMPLRKEDRPDPAFDECHLTGAGRLHVDARGKSAAFPSSEAAIILYDRMGMKVAEAGLPHDIYRLSVTPNGHSFATLSSDCGLYVYDDALNCVFSKDLHDVGTKKNFIRCVDVSPSAEDVLFTVADTAWLIERRGEQRWAVKMPPKDGWEKIVERVDSFSTSQEVDEALRVFKLEFPFDPDDVKRRYRELALQWHPDRNRNNPLALERMQQLNNAFEVLTGVKADFERLTGERVYYKQVLQRERIVIAEAGTEFELECSIVGPGEDWIYAAALTAAGGAYLGAYSGRVVEVDSGGRPIRVIDIGSTPRRIIPNSPYLYLLTSTRLYVIESGMLLRILDIFDQGELLFSQRGFGLITSKSLRWFDASGEELGELSSENPIRRVYPTPGGFAVETRKHRAVLTGMPAWWRED
ncbi:MAG: DnaJ domain-containing protein [Planctomycetota bacterium]|jgi:hypothetical protein